MGQNVFCPIGNQLELCLLRAIHQKRKKLLKKEVVKPKQFLL